MGNEGAYMLRNDKMGVLEGWQPELARAICRLTSAALLRTRLFNGLADFIEVAQSPEGSLCGIPIDLAPFAPYIHEVNGSYKQHAQSNSVTQHSCCRANVFSGDDAVICSESQLRFIYQQNSIYAHLSRMVPRSTEPPA